MAQLVTDNPITRAMNKAHKSRMMVPPIPTSAALKRIKSISRFASGPMTAVTGTARENSQDRPRAGIGVGTVQRIVGAAAD